MRTALLLSLVACKKDDPEPGPPPEPLALVTYNAGLAVGFVPGADSRTPAVADAIGQLDADVVCLQEVWLPEQIAAVEAAASAFPHRFFPAAQQSSDAACDAGEITPVTDCLATNCGDACVDEVADCLLAYCAGPFIGLSLDCQRCAQANVGEDPADVAETCETAPIEFAYGGSFGTGILSKHPFGPVGEHVFFSTSNRRSVLHATIDAPGAEVELYCTHLTAVFDTIPYPRQQADGLFGAAAWEAEQAVQIDEMHALIDDNGGRSVALLGDMNTGPAIGGMDGEAPANWAKFEFEGWDVPYLDLVAGPEDCTYCFDNPLQLGNADDDESRVIDHVMLEGFEGGATAERVLDETTTAESCGTPIDPAALSDHYGVRVTATPVAPPPPATE